MLNIRVKKKNFKKTLLKEEDYLFKLRIQKKLKTLSKITTGKNVKFLSTNIFNILLLINQRFERLVTNIYKLRRGRTSPVEGISRLLLRITARDDRNISIFVATFTTDGRISRSGAVPKEISTDFLNRAESWIYEKILSNNVSPRTSCRSDTI